MDIEEARAALTRVKYHGMTFSVARLDGVLSLEKDRFYFHIVHDVLDSETLKPTKTLTRQMVDGRLFKTGDDFLNWVWYEVKNRVLHEAGEFFLVDGRRPHDPHRLRRDTVNGQ